jgi:hypothetical protein
MTYLNPPTININDVVEIRKVKPRVYHCWHECSPRPVRNVSAYNICCRCDKRTKRKVRNYYTKEGLVKLTCKLSKNSLMWAEGYRK